MKLIQTILIFFAALVVAVPSALASDLPACPSDTSAYWHNCFGVQNFEGGDVYVGEYRDDKANGQGTYTFADGDKYVGKFRDNKFNGQGTYTFVEGIKYVGEYRDNKRHGQFTVTYASGDKFVGEFRDGKKNGQGTHTSASGNRYVGEYRDGKRNGQFTVTFASGDKFVGEFRDDKANGQGTYTYADGSKDVGTFKDDALNGYAVRYDSDGTILKQGIWKDDEFQYAQNSSPSPPASSLPACPSDASAYWHNCYGTYTSAKGHKYVGEFRDDKKNGEFTVTYASGDKFVGEFKDGKKHGLGTYTYAKGDKYVGEHKDGEKHGQGTYTFANGNKYVGEYRDGKRHGQGIDTFADGDKYVGEYRDNKYHGQGTYTYANGVKEVGEYRDGLLNGYAVRYSSDGTILKQGIWKDDDFQYAQNSPSTPPKPTDSTPSQEDSQIVSASSGSGFAVSNDGYLVTNNHVIEGCQKVFVHRRGKKYETDIVAFDTRNDLALLKGNFQPDVVLPLSSAKPYLAQDIYVSGYPFGTNISSSVKVTRGIISSLTGFGNNLAEMQIDAALQSGNSGGPILDEYGNVVGVAVAKLDVKFALEKFGAIPENTNFGVKANIVEALLDANGVVYQKGKGEKPSGAEFSDMLSNGTYYISCWMTLAQIEAMKTKKVMFSDLQ